MPTILVTAPYLRRYLDRAQKIFDHYGLETIYDLAGEHLHEDQLMKHNGKYDAAVCGDDEFTRMVLESNLPRLKIISKWGTGINSIDTDAAEELGVIVGNTPNAFTLPVSDTVLAYMLAFARQIVWVDREIRSGRWEKLPVHSLSECTLGVIGVGNIGSAVIRRAKAFGMHILATDIRPIKRDFVLETGVKLVSLEELLRQSDYVSLNTDLNPTSYHLMNAETLALMKPNAVLINTSRGPVVDQPALVEALKNGQIAGAALDVFEEEPLLPDHPLCQMDNVLVSPHNANASPAALEHVFYNTFHNLLTGLEIPHEDLVEVGNFGVEEDKYA
ncbi:MAG: phosphoglycerate dehydrogenase [Anaerolineae bacterium]|jgi:D-3-phosphoglycerate dehydrogenase|nr:phosphoglycerate dehydrogenase [Anaerolineae bacterium]